MVKEITKFLCSVCEKECYTEEVTDHELFHTEADPKIIAEILHDKLCKSSHNDECTWFWNNNSDAKKIWLEKAEAFQGLVKKYNINPRESLDLIKKLRLTYLV